MAHAMEHCSRPWWKRPPVWFLGIAVLLALIVGVTIERSGKSASLPYTTFLDQLDAGNVASIKVQGTEISGHFKRPLDAAGSGTAQGDTFSSRVPDFGDPNLISQLRKQHVAVEVTSPSAWAWLLGRVPWPMLIFVGVMLVAGLIRLIRGGKTQSGSASMPMHGPMGLIAGLFAKQQPTASPAGPHSGEMKSG